MSPNLDFSIFRWSLDSWRNWEIGFLIWHLKQTAQWTLSEHDTDPVRYGIQNKENKVMVMALQVICLCKHWVKPEFLRFLFEFIGDWEQANLLTYWKKKHCILFSLLNGLSYFKDTEPNPEKYYTSPTISEIWIHKPHNYYQAI